jgi:hypothetical protein
VVEGEGREEGAYPVLKYVWRWDVYRVPGNWSIALHLCVPPIRHFCIGVQAFGWVVSYGKCVDWESEGIPF